MLWIEFSTVNEKAILVNVNNIAFIRSSSSERTDIYFTSGAEMEVQGSYDEILKRLQDLPGNRVK